MSLLIFSIYMKNLHIYAHVFKKKFIISIIIIIEKL